MKASEFIDIHLFESDNDLLKLKLVDKNGNWHDIGPDEDMPDVVYGWVIYAKGKFPTSIIPELLECIKQVIYVG